MSRTPKGQTKHSHRDAFNRKGGCPRCEELSVATLSALSDEAYRLFKAAAQHPNYAPSEPMEAIFIPGEQPWVQQRKAMCWICLELHRTADCPHRERAARGGGNAAAVVRSLK